jgi:hypothetical protein
MKNQIGGYNNAQRIIIPSFIVLCKDNGYRKNKESISR